MPELQLLPNVWIGDSHPCFTIAEVGQNHQGSVEEAKKLIEAAARAKADCVKFQKTSLPDKFTKFALARAYNSINSWGNTYGEHKKYLEFSDDEFIELREFAKNANILFTASTKDIKSLHFLLKLDVPFIKIGSGDSDDFLLLREAAECGKPLIISTGMQDIDTVRKVYKTVKSYHRNFALLHCVSSYPTDPENVNLRVIEQYKKEFPDVVIGYSGHEIGNAVVAGAVALGAKVIEKHITLGKDQKGSDHKCSLNPEEYQQMVLDIRKVEKALGHAKKEFLPCEKECFEKLGKSVVAARNLSSGEIISESAIKLKVSEPSGIPSRDFEDVLGAQLINDVQYDEPILKENLLI